MAQLDRRQRELTDLQRQVELAKEQIARDRGALEEQRKAVDNREQQATKLETDKGFQDCLALYRSMPGKQVKTIFLSLDQQTVAQYLQAMEARTAGRIIKEFKSPEETQFIQKVLERIRQPASPPAPAQQPPSPTQASAGAP
jgi:Mg/Co/Ni transporter MgtE